MNTSVFKGSATAIITPMKWMVLFLIKKWENF